MSPNFLTKAGFIAMVGVVVAWVGFRGIRRDVEVDYKGCKGTYPQYFVKPFLPDLVCQLWHLKPCGSFVDHRVHNAHVNLLDCLCRNPFLHAKNILEYQDEHYRPEVRQPTPELICKSLNAPWFPSK